jgi:hypothetical protein
LVKGEAREEEKSGNKAAEDMAHSREASFVTCILQVDLVLIISAMKTLLREWHDNHRYFLPHNQHSFLLNFLALSLIPPIASVSIPNLIMA